MKKLRKNQKGFTVFEALLIVLFLGLVGVIGWRVLSNRTASTAETKVLPKTASHKTATPQITKLSTQKYSLTTYQSSENGFSMLVPKEIYDSYGGCKKQGNSYGPENKWVPTKVFEQSGTIYITATYFYSLSNSFNLPHGGLGFKTCEKIEKSFSTVDDRMSSRPSDYTAFEVLPLYIGNASNLTEINTFLRQKIWENYKVAKLTDGPTNEWQEVELGLIDENDSGGQGKTVIRYYPSRQKVIAWSIGQHNHYVNPSGNNDDTDYVQQMVDSLKFD